MPVRSTTALQQSVAETPQNGGILRRACACGNHTSGGGECESCKNKREGALQRAATNNGPLNEVPSIVHEVLREPGQPLDAGTRGFMEPRFGHDFSQVRVHADTKASASAQAVNALAYTVGRDVVFGTGQYSPQTHGGRRLMAHELTHIVQQSKLSPRMQRKPDSRPSPNVQFRYSVKIEKFVDSDQLLLEFIKQYRRVATDVEAAALRDQEKWAWAGAPPSVKQTDVDMGYILIPVTDQTIRPATEGEKKKRDQYIKELPQGEQAAINAEADVQFWESTQYRVGEKLGTSTDDKQMAQYWKVLRHELIRKRQAIEALPPDIQKFLIDEKMPAIEPRDFDTVRRIMSKVATLTPAQLAEYESRVTAKTTNWSVYEASIDQYLVERKERETTAKEKFTIETRLAGLDDLYDRYRNYLSMLKDNARLTSLGAFSPKALGTAAGAQPTLNKMQAELEADLITAGFPGGIAEFTLFIQDYEKVFERETLSIANVMLDQYGHLLLGEEQRYQNPALAAELPKAAQLIHRIQGLKTRADFEISKEAESIIKRHPLVRNFDIIDAEKFSQALEGEAQGMMLGYIKERKVAIADTRKNLAAKPMMIYGDLPDLFNSSLQIQNIQSGTIHEKIILNHKSEVGWEEAIPDFILAAIAIGAGLLTGGTGTVAILAGGTALGIGAYQAVQAFQHYEAMSSAHGAGLLNEEPSFAWVVVAVIGAGLDAGVLVKVLPKLTPALRAFNTGDEVSDIAKLTQRLNALEELTKVEKDICNSIIRAADAEVEARAAWKAVFRPPSVLRMVIVPGAEEFGRLVYAVYLTVVDRGIREFQKFVKLNEAIDLIGDITKLPAADLATLKIGYLKAIEEMEAVAAHGKALAMPDNVIRSFMHLRGNAKGMTVGQLVKEMDAWKVAKESGVPFGFQSAEQFGKFQSTASKELTKVLRKADPSAEAFLQGSSITGVSYERYLPFDLESDFDVAIASRYLFKQAQEWIRNAGEPGLKKLISTNPSRIGPLNPALIQDLGLNKFQRQLGEAAETTRDINLMLFQNAEAVKKPLGEASKEIERAAVSLKVEK